MSRNKHNIRRLVSTSREAMSSVHNQLIRDSTWRHERVSVAAYYLWQQRGLNGGIDRNDWELAEAQINALDEL